MNAMAQWMTMYEDRVKGVFKNRVLFIGLQGSRGRGEAKEDSDIDVVLLLDKVKRTDLALYKKEVLHKMPEKEKICGFVSGREELSGWNPGELFQFYYDTQAYWGSLKTLIPVPGKAAARQSVQQGACSLYHSCSHNYLHGESRQVLQDLYKGAVFTLQAKHYCETGNYIHKHRDLEPHLKGTDLTVMQYARQLRKGLWPADKDACTDVMLEWSRKLISEYAAGEEGCES